MQFIDLFAGIGGFHFAMGEKNECVFVSEYDKYARITYERFFDTSGFEFAGDITGVNPKNIPDHDVLCAGFPCQPFSIAGKREGFTHKTQGTLFFNICEILRIKKPKAFILENVKNLKGHDKGRTYRVIGDALTELGYTWKSEILNTATHGNLPQNRERIFFVGFRDSSVDFQFPGKIELTKSLFGRNGIIDLSCRKDDKYYQTNMDSPSVKKMVAGITEKNCVYQYRRFYIRKNATGVCPTLTANMGGGGHNVPLILDNFGVRKLTPQECFALQGFPNDNLPDIAESRLYMQAGNAVSIPVVERIIREVEKHI